GEGHGIACVDADNMWRWNLHFLASDSPGNPGTTLQLGRLNLGRMTLFGSPAVRDQGVLALGSMPVTPAAVVGRPREREITQRLAVPSTPHVAAFSPDGRTLALATTEAIVRWNVATLDPLPLLRGHGRLIQAVGYLPDGRLLSCSNDGTVRTWDGEKCV